MPTKLTRMCSFLRSTIRATTEDLLEELSKVAMPVFIIKEIVSNSHERNRICLLFMELLRLRY